MGRRPRVAANITESPRESMIPGHVRSLAHTAGDRLGQRNRSSLATTASAKLIGHENQMLDGTRRIKLGGLEIGQFKVAQSYSRGPLAPSPADRRRQADGFSPPAMSSAVPERRLARHEWNW